VRRFVLQQQAKRFILRTLVQKLERHIRQYIRDVAASFGSLSHFDELRIEVVALAGQDAPEIETGGVVGDMPFAYESGMVAARCRGVEKVSCVGENRSSKVKMPLS